MSESAGTKAARALLARMDEEEGGPGIPTSTAAKGGLTAAVKEVDPAPKPKKEKKPPAESAGTKAARSLLARMDEEEGGPGIPTSTAAKGGLTAAVMEADPAPKPK